MSDEKTNEKPARVITNDGEKPKAPVQAAPVQVIDKDTVMELLRQNKEMFAEMIKEVQATAKEPAPRVPYNPNLDVPNPNIPPESFIPDGCKMLLPIYMTCIAPYKMNGVVQPHPQGKQLVVFQFSHDKPAVREGRQDKIAYSSYFTRDRREVDWLKAEPLWGHRLIIPGEQEDVIGTDADLSVELLKNAQRFAHMNIGDLISLGRKTPSVKVTDDMDKLRSTLVQHYANKIIQASRGGAVLQSTEQKKETLMQNV